MKQSVKYLKIAANILLWLVLLFVIVFIVPRILVFFMPFVVGFILSLIANPLVRFLESKIKIKRKYGTFLLIIFVIGAVALLCYGAGTALMVGLQGFASYLPTMYANAGTEIHNALTHFLTLLNRIPVLAEVDISYIEDMTQNILNELMNSYKEPTVSAIGDLAKSIPDMLVNIIMGFLATYFFIAERERLIRGLKRYLPESFQKKTMAAYSQIQKAVGGYFKAQFKIMGVIYLLVLAGLLLLRVNYAWLIGFGIAFLDMLPVFGTGTVLVPWAVIKLFSGNFTTAAGMLVLYGVTLVVHQLIQPKMVGSSVGLDTFTTLIYMYVGYRIYGVVGMIIAIPVGMILSSLYEAGAFARIIWCMKEIGNDFLAFCQIGPDEKKEK